MDLKGSLVDTNVRIYPSEKLIDFINTLKDNDVPDNISDFIKSKSKINKKKNEDTNIIPVNLTNKDIEHLKKVKEIVGNIESTKSISDSSSDNSSEKELKPDESKENVSTENCEKDKDKIEDKKDEHSEETPNEIKIPPKEGPFLITSDLDWLYIKLKALREIKNKSDEAVPYLHQLIEGSEIVMPENKTVKRNPVLEARCVKLRAQQEAREYRKMTKGVDNVRIKFPEDSISYQLKQLNRQLIAVGQFILSIFAGFLFGFKGIEWMIGPMDFGFRLLLGVMIALVIALAEIYFLAKKLNEELNVPETTQLGGPPKFADEKRNNYTMKEHQD